jgi:hypothetical protein
MSRLVTPQATDPQLQGGTPPDDYPDRVAKYIPAEFVAAYLGVQSIVAASTESKTLKIWLLVVTAILALVLLPVYYRRRATKEHKPWKLQTLISVAAFVLWVYALGVLPSLMDFYSATVGGVLLVLYSFAVGVLQPAPEA